MKPKKIKRVVLGVKYTDKQMLDWLQRHKALLDASCYRNEISPMVAVQANGFHGYGFTVREAISRAMRSKKV